MVTIMSPTATIFAVNSRFAVTTVFAVISVPVGGLTTVPSGGFSVAVTTVFAVISVPVGGLTTVPSGGRIPRPGLLLVVNDGLVHLLMRRSKLLLVHLLMRRNQLLLVHLMNIPVFPGGHGRTRRP